MYTVEAEPGATKADGTRVSFATLCRVDTRIEGEYYRNGGILQTVIRKKLNEIRSPAMAS